MSGSRGSSLTGQIAPPRPGAGALPLLGVGSASTSTTLRGCPLVRCPPAYHRPALIAGLAQIRRPRLHESPPALKRASQIAQP